MKRLSSFFYVAGLSLLSLTALTGCSGNFAVPESGSPIEPTATSSPTISGSVFGGHAPIVGAKVYILKPSNAGFAGPGIAASTANLSTSVMCGDSPAVACTASGSGNGAVAGGTVTTANPYGYHYVTTDNEGYFNLTGDYDCSVDSAIYVVAVGGSPAYPYNAITGGPTTYAVSNITVGTAGLGKATFTFTVSQPPEEYYAGETITFSGFTGTLAGINGQSGTVLADAKLTTTTFDVVLSTGGTIGSGGYTSTTGKAAGSPQNNPAVVNMAALGLCPAPAGSASSGSFTNGNAGSISFLFMNEISTTAMAYSMAGFGTDAFHIGVAAGGADATYSNGLTGIAAITGDSRAAYTLDGMKEALYDTFNLYDVTGTNVSTTFAGEGHIARTVTPGGNGAVPQAELDTLGNILAACVDSANTNSSTGVSLQCNILFSNATSTGIACTPGSQVGSSIFYSAPTCATGTTAPADIATAAFNIAHHPQGQGNSTFVNTLYTLPQGTLPFSPELSSCTSGTAGCPVSGQPGDFTVELAFTAPSSSGGTDNLISSVNTMAIDGNSFVGGNHGATGPEPAIWIANNNKAPVKMFTRTGLPDFATDSLLAAEVYNDQRSMAVDYNNNVWMTLPDQNLIEVVGNNGGAPEFTGTTAATGTVPIFYSAVTFGAFSYPYGAVIDSTGNVYVTNYNNNYTQKLTKTGLNASTGSATTPWSTTSNNQNPNNGLSATTSGGMTAALDNLGNLFEMATFGSADSYYTTGTNYGKYEFTPSGGLYTDGTQGYISVDHNNVVWTTYPGNGIVSFSRAAGTEVNNYGPGYGGASIAGVSTGCSTAVDGAGVIWIGNAGNASVSAITASGTALSSSSPQTGAPSANTGSYAPLGTSQNCAMPVVDRAGNVWLGFKGGSTAAGTHIYKLVGAAAPIATPVSYQTVNNLLGVLP